VFEKLYSDLTIPHSSLLPQDTVENTQIFTFKKVTFVEVFLEDSF